jgi:hypothetical protein
MENLMPLTQILCLLAALSNLLAQTSARLAADADILQLSERAHSAKAKGTHIDIPWAILAKIRVNPSDCQIGAPDETNLFDTYQVSPRSKGDGVIVVWGRGSCYCSVTGNCAFWIFRQGSNGYEPLLETNMVRDFGFLPTSCNGHRDFVAWSHDSAELSPARLYRFDGTAYRDVCGWDEETKYREGSDGSWVGGKAKIERNSCAAAELRSK